MGTQYTVDVTKSSEGQGVTDILCLKEITSLHQYVLVFGYRPILKYSVAKLTKLNTIATSRLFK